MSIIYPVMEEPSHKRQAEMVADVEIGSNV
jgi:hypothetical protein